MLINYFPIFILINTYLITISGYKLDKNITIRSLMSNSTDFKIVAKEILGNGKMADSCLTYAQFEELIKKLQDEFPNLLELEEIGKTYRNNSIFAIKVKNKYHSNRGILFTGMHHAREPTSMMMNLYILLKLIHIETIGGDHTSDLLNSVNIYFIPVINVDGYIANNDLYFKSNRNIDSCMIRKNRKDIPYVKFKQCKQNEDNNFITVGVDLNRNYGYKFAFDDNGSSPDPCDESYRGEFPFSELETQAIKNFIEKYTEIKIAYNYHAYGNLLIKPFNYADTKVSSFNYYMNYTQEKHIYDEFAKEGNFPENNKYGNGIETVNYVANGEAADWMLGEKHIIAFSPELGVKELNSETFYPNKASLFKVMENNIYSALYGISRAAFYLKFSPLKNKYIDCRETVIVEHIFLPKTDDEKMEESFCNKDSLEFTSQIQLNNNGFTDFRGLIHFEIKFDVMFIQYLSIKLNSGRHPMTVSFNTTSSNVETMIINKYPSVVKLFEKNYKTESARNAFIETIRFNISYIESFNNEVLDILFFINKKDVYKNSEIMYNSTIFSINKIETHNKSKNDFIFEENMKLKYNKPEYQIKLNEFTKIQLISLVEPSKGKFSIRSYYKYFILGLLMVLIGVILVTIFKLRSINNQNSVQNPNNPNSERSQSTTSNSYIELDITNPEINQ